MATIQINSSIENTNNTNFLKKTLLDMVLCKYVTILNAKGSFSYPEVQQFHSIQTSYPNIT